MDPETNFDGVRNVGIKDGKIVAITKDAIKGKETINAKGHVVAPGFIEGHQHGTDPFTRKVNLRDGLTTQMDFEAGAGDIAKWYAGAEGKTQSNYGMVVLATLARASVLDGPEIAASGNEMGTLFRSVVPARRGKGPERRTQARLVIHLAQQRGADQDLKLCRRRPSPRRLGRGYSGRLYDHGCHPVRSCISIRSWRQNTVELPMDMYALLVFARPPRGHWAFRRCCPMPWFWMRLSWRHI